MKKIIKNPYLQFILLGVLLYFMPTLARMGYIQNAHIVVIGTTLIYTIAALGLNVLLGYSGMVSLGTAGFMGLGAYITAFLTEKMAMPFEASLLIALIVPVVLGFVVGLLSLRFEGIYLAIATLAVSEILREIFSQWDWFTNGASGAPANYPKLLGGMIKLDRLSTYTFIVVVTIIVFILVHNLTKGRLGRALNAMRGSESAAKAMGIHLFKYRLIAFAIATALASLAGVLYVHYIRLSYPTIWTLNLSLDFLAIIVIGGLRSIYGTLIGAFVVFGLSEVLLKQIKELAQFAYILKGVLMILFVIYYPYGIVHLKHDLKKLKNKLFKSKGKQEVAS